MNAIEGLAPGGAAAGGSIFVGGAGFCGAVLFEQFVGLMGELGFFGAGAVLVASAEDLELPNDAVHLVAVALVGGGAKVLGKLLELLGGGRGGRGGGVGGPGRRRGGRRGWRLGGGARIRGCSHGGCGAYDLRRGDSGGFAFGRLRG